MRTLTLVALMLVACTSADEMFQKAPEPPAGLGLVYLYRVDTWPTVRSDALFALHGKTVAALPANTYTWIYLQPGRHELEQRWDNPQVTKVASHSFSVEAGSVHYVRLNVEGEIRQMRWWMRNVAEAQALEQLAKCRRQAPRG